MQQPAIRKWLDEVSRVPAAPTPTPITLKIPDSGKQPAKEKYAHHESQDALEAQEKPVQGAAGSESVRSSTSQMRKPAGGSSSSFISDWVRADKFIPGIGSPST